MHLVLKKSKFWNLGKYFFFQYVDVTFSMTVTSVTQWAQKRHSIPRPRGRAMECLLWLFWRKTLIFVVKSFDYIYMAIQHKNWHQVLDFMCVCLYSYCVSKSSEQCKLGPVTWWILLVQLSWGPIKSKQLIWWSRSHRFYLRIPSHQISWCECTNMPEYQDSSSCSDC